MPNITVKGEAVILMGAFSFPEAVQVHEDLCSLLLPPRGQDTATNASFDPAVTYIEAGGKFSQLSPSPSESFKKA